MASQAILTLSVAETASPQPAAIRYAIQELARRAGVSKQLFSTWYVEFSAGHVDVYVAPGTTKRVRFPRAGAAQWAAIQRGHFTTASARWMTGGSPAASLPQDLAIPFASAEEELGPIFYKDSMCGYTCATDLPLSVLLTLSRFEETLPFTADTHGRFPSSSSMAVRNSFLHRPIVDEYGLAFEQVLADLLPNRKPAARTLRVKLSHDVDEIGIPFSFRGALAKAVKHRRPSLMLRDLAAPLFRSETAYQRELRLLVHASLQNRVNTAIYWKASTPGPFDTGYAIDDPHFHQFIAQFQELGIEMGIHPSYRTFESPELLRAEVERIRVVLKTYELGGRQDYLRWKPATWSAWDALNISYDCSLGYADNVGFRAGTCIPYRPWLWNEQREASLLEIPLIAMDSALRGYMGLSAGQASAQLRRLVERCASVGGVFTLAWHNTTMLHPDYAATYHSMLQLIAGSPNYDWRTADA